MSQRTAGVRRWMVGQEEEEVQASGRGKRSMGRRVQMGWEQERVPRGCMSRRSTSLSLTALTVQH
jgi:hypothetical protein